MLHECHSRTEADPVSVFGGARPRKVSGQTSPGHHQRAPKEDTSLLGGPASYEASHQIRELCLFQQHGPPKVLQDLGPARVLARCDLVNDICPWVFP